MRIARSARDPLGVLNKEKAGYFVPGFFLVDKRFEISNLLKDIFELIKLSDTLILTSEQAE
jgi:hypothetical protein